MNIEIINTEKQFLAIRREWNQLYEKCNYVTPFQMWKWNYLYWKYFKGDKKLNILLFKNDLELLGIFPFWTRNQFGYKILEPIGTRGTDYINLLINPNSFNETLKTFFEWFVRSDLDLINIEDLPETTPYLNGFLELSVLFKTYHNLNETYCPCFVINLPDKWKSYLDLLSKRMRKDTVYYRRYADGRFGKVELIEGNASDIDKHFEMHQKIREFKGDKGAYLKPLVKKFMADYAEMMETLGKLRLMFLLLDGNYTASILAVEDNNKRYDITVGYDPEYAKFRPGTLLYGYDIEDCIERKIRHYDLSRGADAYKNAFGARQKYNVRLIISKIEKNIPDYLEKHGEFMMGQDFAPSEW